MNKQEVITQLMEYDESEPEWMECLPLSLEGCSMFILETLLKKAIEIFGDDYVGTYKYSTHEEESRILKQIILRVLTPESEEWSITIKRGQRVSTNSLTQNIVMSLTDSITVGNQIQIYSTKGISTVIEIETEVDVSLIANSILESFDRYEFANY